MSRLLTGSVLYWLVCYSTVLGGRKEAEKSAAGRKRQKKKNAHKVYYKNKGNKMNILGL